MLFRSMVDADAIPASWTFITLADKIETEECVAAVPYVASGGQICVYENSPPLKDVDDLQGFHPVNNIGTHCIGYNIKVFDKIQKPYFEYHYTSGHEMLAGEAEDTVLNRKLFQAGVPIYCNFSLWAGHVCSKTCSKPRLLSPFEKMLLLAAQG